MGFFDDIKQKAEKIGNKVADTAIHGLTLGQKVTGTVSKIGHKFVDKADSAINTVSKIPVVGGLAEPVLGIAREGVNVGRSALGVVDTANAGMSAAEKGIRGFKTAIAAGDIHQAAKTMRDTTKDAFAAAGSVRTQAKSTLQKARKP